MQYQYEVVVKQVGDRHFVAHCASLPGCVAEGPTPADAVAKLKGVIAEYVKSRPQQEKMKCDVGNCEVEPTFHFTAIESRRVLYEKYLCEPHAHKFFMDFRSNESIGRGVRHVTEDAACVDLEMLAYRMGRENDPVCMYVHEVGGSRRVCILTDGWAWWAIMAQLKQEPTHRPRTHAAWGATIRELGGELQDVVLDRREGEDWWAAKLRIVKDGRLMGLDVRASDAYILAVMHGVPIFVVETALERFADRRESTSDD